jgi:hypothetical protein
MSLTLKGFSETPVAVFYPGCFASIAEAWWQVDEITLKSLDMFPVRY